MIRKIRAFTIIELVVVMILSGIIIGIVYSAYQIVSSQYENYRKANNQNTSMAVLTLLLNRDFSTAYSIKKEGERISFFDQENKVCSYAFAEDFIIRSTNAVEDTFHIHTFNIEVLFLNQPQSSYTGLIDEVYFESMIFEEQQLFRFKKQYAADVLMGSETGN